MAMKVGGMLLALMLVPALALAATTEGTVVKLDKVKNELVLKTQQGEKTFQVSSNTKGLDKARPGAKIMINYEQKGNRLMAGEITASATSPKPAPGSKPAPEYEKTGGPAAPRTP